MRDKICGIYSYRDLFDGYKIVYIGQSNDVYNRHCAHKRNKKYNQHIDKKILENDRRYVFRLEEECNESELNILEAKYINIYKPKYNYRAGGDYVRERRSAGRKSDYTLWDSAKTHYVSHVNQNRNKPFRCYKDGTYLDIGYFHEWFTIYKIHELIEWGLQNET